MKKPTFVICRQRAQAIAARLARELRPACHDLRLVGELAGTEPWVHAVTLEAVPRFRWTAPDAQSSLFSAQRMQEENALWHVLDALSKAGTVQPISTYRPIAHRGLAEDVLPDALEAAPGFYHRRDPDWRAKRTAPASGIWRFFLPDPKATLFVHLVAAEAGGAALRTAS